MRGAYDKSPSAEEPCAAKVASTVLETSKGGDPLAEFNSLVSLWKLVQRGCLPVIGNVKLQEWNRNVSFTTGFYRLSLSEPPELQPMLTILVPSY